MPQDSLRRVLDRIFEAPEFDWDSTRPQATWLLDRYRDLLLWLDGLHATHPFAYWVVMGAMLVVLVLMLGHFAQLAVQALRYEPPSPGPKEGAPATVRDARWYLLEAQRSSDEGRFGEAVAHRFAALVLGLDSLRAVRYHPAKTPAEYVREARVDEPDRAVLRELVGDLYRHLFGGVPCTRDQWSAFDAAAAHVEQHAAPA